MDKMIEILNKLELDNKITLEDIPDIDLYMDQVIQLFEKKFNGAKRNKEEKVLTKTMINNYAKGKLFFPIKNKKYSKEHLILISMIYQLKGSLSISDVKVTLQELNKIVAEEDGHLDDFYSSFLTLNAKNLENFYGDIDRHILEVREETKKINDSEHEGLEQILLIASMVNKSNLYRRTAEKLVDELIEGSESKLKAP